VSTDAAPVRIRAARPYDAAALLELKRQPDRETAFMMYEPGERDSSVQDLAADLASLARSANSVVLVAERADQLIGYVQLTGGTVRRSRATAYLTVRVPTKSELLRTRPRYFPHLCHTRLLRPSRISPARPVAHS